MKFTALLLTLSSPALALPSNGGAAGSDLLKRQSLNQITDQLLFSLSLSAFNARRDARDPPSLDWSSDSCST